jgi:hypothetical protein
MRLLGFLTRGMYVDDCVNVDPEVIERYYGVVGPERQHRHGHTGAGHDDDESNSDDTPSDTSMDLASASENGSEWGGIDLSEDEDLESSQSEEDHIHYDNEDWEDLVDELGENEEGAVTSDEMQRQIIEGIMADTEKNFLHDAVEVPKFPDPLRHFSEDVQDAFQNALTAIRSGQHAVPHNFGLYPDEWEDGEYQPLSSERIDSEENTLKRSIWTTIEYSYIIIAPYLDSLKRNHTWNQGY